MNAKISVGLLSALILNGAVQFPSAHAQVAGATVGAGLAQASGVIDDISQQAGNEANYVVFSAAAELRVLVETLRISASDVLDKGFGELNSSQQQAFDNIQKGLKSLRQAIDEPIEQGRQTVEEIHQMVNDVPVVGKGESVLLRSRPAVVAPSGLTEIPFTIRGLSLDKANPRLQINGKDASRIELTQQQAIFKVPASLFSFQKSAPTLYSGKIILNVKECTFLVFCDIVQREYHIGVMALPQQLATVQVTFNRKGDQKIYSSKERNFGFSTGDLTREKCTKEPQAPHAPGYVIDVESFSAKRIHGKARNRFEILNLNPGGFTVEMCAQSQINNLKKYSGEITVHATWKEYRTEQAVTPFEALGEKSLLWQSPLSVALPNDAHAIEVSLNYFDGSNASFIGNDADKFVDIKWNSATRQLVVTPKKPTSIDGIN